MVDVEADDAIVAVSVTNFGYVIPEKDLPLLFSKFYRVENSRSTATGGTGLGLAIAKNIVDMHGGDIQVNTAVKIRRQTSAVFTAPAACFLLTPISFSSNLAKIFFVNVKIRLQFYGKYRTV